jgi:crossover junction endodeoxyribonuclease RusA
VKPLEFPYPPSVNRYWRSFRGRMVRSSVAVAYKEEVQRIASLSGLKLHEGPVSVEMTLHPPRPKDWAKRMKQDAHWALNVRRIDLDNAQKVVLDALQGIAYENDRQITAISISLGVPLEGGGLTLSVEPDTVWRRVA